MSEERKREGEEEMMRGEEEERMRAVVVCFGVGRLWWPLTGR